GTAAYMSPEQAKGRAADKRSDVWAFGCVLFEMLTGRRAFEGDDVSDTLAAVLRGDPPLDALPPSLPLPIHALLKGCLERNPRDRGSDMSTAVFVLKHDPSRTVDAPARASGPAVRRRWPLAAMAVAGFAIGAAAAVAFWPRASVRDLRIVRFALPMTEG